MVVSVAEEALAISLELTLQTLDLRVLIHDPATGLASLALEPGSTLIIDRDLLPRDPRGFVSQLRAQLWRGIAIVLTEDAAKADLIFEPAQGVKIIEKPFGSHELITLIRDGHPAQA